MKTQKYILYLGDQILENLFLRSRTISNHGAQVATPDIIGEIEVVLENKGDPPENYFSRFEKMINKEKDGEDSEDEDENSDPIQNVKPQLAQ